MNAAIASSSFSITVLKTSAFAAASPSRAALSSFRYSSSTPDFVSSGVLAIASSTALIAAA